MAGDGVAGGHCGWLVGVRGGEMLLVEREAVGCAVWGLLGGVHIDLMEAGGNL